MEQKLRVLLNDLANLHGQVGEMIEAVKATECKGVTMSPGEHEFTEFLKENNCYSEFMENFKRFWSNSDLQTFLSRTPKRDNFTSAFNWETTSSGYTYWEGFSIKWKSL